jgi:hypothetical protein
VLGRPDLLTGRLTAKGVPPRTGTPQTSCLAKAGGKHLACQHFIDANSEDEGPPKPRVLHQTTEKATKPVVTAAPTL